MDDSYGISFPWDSLATFAGPRMKNWLFPSRWCSDFSSFYIPICAKSILVPCLMRCYRRWWKYILFRFTTAASSRLLHTLVLSAGEGFMLRVVFRCDLYRVLRQKRLSFTRFRVFENECRFPHFSSTSCSSFRFRDNLHGPLRPTEHGTGSFDRNTIFAVLLSPSPG